MDHAPTPSKPHSAEYLGEQRDYWWDSDSIALLAKTLGFGGCARVLDVGCGVGHWGRVLLPHLPEDAQLVGIDREAEWVERATASAAATGIGGRARYQRGDACSLPFGDGEFDLVTCQTVLIHMADCRAVIREMMRVTRPGGCVLAAEPNNLAATQVVGNNRFHEPVEQRMALTRFQLVCERGKESLGEGNNSVGELVPGYFAEAGLEDVRVRMSGRASTLIPPYASPGERAMRDQIIDWARRDFWIWSRDDAKRYFLAGGGDDAEFEQVWQLAMMVAKSEADELERGTFHCAGGGVFYVVAGWKPKCV
jgi:SAM-dependent methyltransferase